MKLLFFAFLMAFVRCNGGGGQQEAKKPEITTQLYYYQLVPPMKYEIVIVSGKLNSQYPRVHTQLDTDSLGNFVVTSKELSLNSRGDLIIWYAFPETNFDDLRIIAMFDNAEQMRATRGRVYMNKEYANYSMPEQIPFEMLTPAVEKKQQRKN
ncbi:hypothetical protein GPALN_010403 [Globodera pallida]|nr:hypothetical protein GPALN_010403 [Globodera pallida]